MITFNIFTGNFDFVGSSDDGSVIFPEYDLDPVGPSFGEAWILRTIEAFGGDLLYFHGAMPVTTNDEYKFEFSVLTTGGIKRTLLT